jgi:predicted small integral membrane protein
MNPYLKFVAEVLATVLAAVAAAVAGDGVISTTEWLNVVVLGLGAVGVLGAGNLPAGVWAYTKAIVAAATAGAVFLMSALTNGSVDTAEWFQFGVAVLGALGVFAAPGPVVDHVAHRGLRH